LSVFAGSAWAEGIRLLNPVSAIKLLAMIWRLGLLGKVKDVMPSILAARLPGRAIGLWVPFPLMKTSVEWDVHQRLLAAWKGRFLSG